MTADQPVPGRLLGQLLRDVDGEVPPELKSKAGRTLSKLGWSRVPPAERTARTAAGSTAAWEKFLHLVDPEHHFPDEVREMLAREARSAHMTELVMRRHHGRKVGESGPLSGAHGDDAA